MECHALPLISLSSLSLCFSFASSMFESGKYKEKVHGCVRLRAFARKWSAHTHSHIRQRDTSNRFFERILAHSRTQKIECHYYWALAEMWFIYHLWIQQKWQNAIRSMEVASASKNTIVFFVVGKSCHNGARWLPLPLLPPNVEKTREKKNRKWALWVRVRAVNEHSWRRKRGRRRRKYIFASFGRSKKPDAISVIWFDDATATTILSRRFRNRINCTRPKWTSIHQPSLGIWIIYIFIAKDSEQIRGTEMMANDQIMNCCWIGRGELLHHDFRYGELDLYSSNIYTMIHAIQMLSVISRINRSSPMSLL